MIRKRGSEDNRTVRIARLVRYLYERGPKTKEEIISEFYEKEDKGVKYESLTRQWHRDKNLLKKRGY